jgi:23S rRNA pseudouridine1911/1915/1917 synthase
LIESPPHLVTAAAARLDQYLAALLRDLSRTRVQQLIEDGHVQLNDGPARAGSRLRPGDRLSWQLPPVVATTLLPEAMDLRVLFEDRDLLVIDKPAGLVVHPGPGHATGTLVHGLLARGPGWSSIGGVERPGIVHRLDRDTSGVMVVARNDESHRKLAAQLQQRTMTRQYRAIAVGELPDARARIEAAVGRDPKHRQRMAVVADGRAAVTELQRLELVAGHSLLRVSLGTGRTHQIRVHLAYIRHPVLGDPIYGRRSPLIARPALHAEVLTLLHPRSGQSMSWSTPPPEDFEAAWREVSTRTMR